MPARATFVIVCCFIVCTRAQQAACSDDPNGIISQYGMTCAIVESQVGCGFDINQFDPAVPAGSTVSGMCPVVCGSCRVGSADDPDCRDTLTDYLGQDCASTVAFVQNLEPMLSGLGLQLSSDPGCGTNVGQLVATAGQFLAIGVNNQLGSIGVADTISTYCPVTCHGQLPAKCGGSTAVAPTPEPCQIDSLTPLLVGSCSNIAGMGSGFCHSPCHQDIVNMVDRCGNMDAALKSMMTMFEQMLSQCDEMVDCNLDPYSPGCSGTSRDINGVAFCETGDHFNNRDRTACEAQPCCTWSRAGPRPQGQCLSAVGDMSCTVAAAGATSSDCPFDNNNPDSPCNSEVCRNAEAGAADECCMYAEDYCHRYGSDPGCSAAAFSQLVQNYCPAAATSDDCYTTANVLDCADCPFALAQELGICSNCDLDGNILTAELKGRHPSMVWCPTAMQAQPAHKLPSSSCDLDEISRVCTGGVPTSITFLEMCANPCTRWFADHVSICPASTFTNLGLGTDDLDSFRTLEASCVAEESDIDSTTHPAVALAEFDRDGVIGTITFDQDAGSDITSITINLHGLRFGPNQWHVQAQKITRGQDCIGAGGHLLYNQNGMPVKWDLSSAFGPFTEASPSQEFKIIGLNVLDIVQHTLVIYKASGEPWLCAPIEQLARANIATVELVLPQECMAVARKANCLTKENEHKCGRSCTRENRELIDPVNSECMTAFSQLAGACDMQSNPNDPSCSVLGLMTACSDESGPAGNVCTSSCGLYISQNFDCIISNNLVNGENLEGITVLHDQCAAQESQGLFGDGTCDVMALLTSCDGISSNDEFAANPQAICGTSCGQTVMGEFPDCLQALQGGQTQQQFSRDAIEDVIQTLGGIAALCAGEHQECLSRYQDPQSALTTTILPNCCTNSGQCDDWYLGACPKSCATVFVPFYAVCGEMLYAMAPNAVAIRNDIEDFASTCDAKYVSKGGHH